MEELNLHELVMGDNTRSTGQFDIWEAVFAPIDQNTGYPQRLWDKRTGLMNAGAIAHARENYDLAYMYVDGACPNTAIRVCMLLSQISSASLLSFIIFLPFPNLYTYNRMCIHVLTCICTHLHFFYFQFTKSMRRDWKTLGPKLQGKITLFVGGADTWFLNNAVMLTQVLKTGHWNEGYIYICIKCC